MATPSLHETHRQEVKRCKKCFVNHYPSLQKFCRWAEEHADRNKRKTKKDNSDGSKTMNLSSKYIEMIKARIDFIEEQLHLKNSSHGTKKKRKQKIKKRRIKRRKLSFLQQNHVPKKCQNIKHLKILCL